MQTITCVCRNSEVWRESVGLQVCLEAFGYGQSIAGSRCRWKFGGADRGLWTCKCVRNSKLWIETCGCA